MTSRLMQSRGLAAAASAAKKLPSVSSVPEARMTKLPNGLSVVSAESPSALATLGVFVKTGPRYESYDNQGVSHALRVAGGLGSTKFSFLNITRSMQQAGGPLQIVSGREFIFYASQVHRNNVNDVVDYLMSLATEQTFRDWEIMDEKHRLKIEVEDLEPGVKANELLHKAAFREGLGYSLYSPEHKVSQSRMGNMLMLTPT